MGNTIEAILSAVDQKDHPHIHGEYGCDIHTFTQLRGSPPHTWGIRSAKKGASPLPRITPTYMGNTPILRTYTGITRDHPHIHGEYTRNSSGSADGSGSPPHTWGIRRVFLPDGRVDRITPTYMGNTHGNRNGCDSCVDHPHIHGEYFQVL